MQHSPGSPLLTIGIPTWNRSAMLRSMILSVTHQAETDGVTDLIEIVVSDNDSTDDTQAMVKSIATPVPIRYSKNSENVGAIKNVLKTLSLAEGQHWMFYGDDDEMADGALLQILQLLNNHSDRSVFLFELPEAADLTAEETASQYFYRMGNAGRFVVKTGPAKKALNEMGEELFHTCWPQTQIAFCAMQANPISKPVRTSPLLATVSPHHHENTIYTGWYLWETNFNSLYKTAKNLKQTMGGNFFHAALSHIFSRPRLIFVLKHVYLHTTFFDTSGDIQKLKFETRLSINNKPLLHAVYFTLFWFASIMPKPLKKILFYTLLHIVYPLKAGKILEEIKTKRIQISDLRERIKHNKAIKMYESSAF
ncbi:glycosyltransferase family 2 protein [bacterium]|nr:glycosyltransferase family 2 protein [bacterium]